MPLTAFDEIDPLEHSRRVQRVQSISCRKCQAAVGDPCRHPNGLIAEPHHQERWEDYYAGMSKM